VKRKALIIGSSPAGDPLGGVSRDVENWKAFLVSNSGGAWDEDSEIEVIDGELTIARVLEAKGEMSGADYGLIVFIGHGYVEDDVMGLPETFLIVNDEEVMSERELNPRTPWYMSVMDCCRKYEQVEEVVQVRKAASLEEIAAAPYVRQLFEQTLLRAEKGWVKMYAADLHQSASDEKSFTHILIQEATKWSAANVGVLDTKNAYDLVYKRFEVDNPQQTPIFRAGRRICHFPFSIGAL